LWLARIVRESAAQFHAIFRRVSIRSIRTA
jgi:hypothetical protein